MPIRFHLDENVPFAVAAGLARHDVDVTTSRDAKLLGHDDQDQLVYAASDGRVLVTHDEDFTRIHSQGSQHRGICYCHQDKYTAGQLLRILLLVSECLTDEELHGHLEYL